MHDHITFTVYLTYITTLATNSAVGKVQNMDPRSMDPIRGPGRWTGSIKIWTGSMDQVHGPPIFPAPKNTKENNKKIKEVN